MRASGKDRSAVGVVPGIERCYAVQRRLREIAPGLIFTKSGCSSVIDPAPSVQVNVMLEKAPSLLVRFFYSKIRALDAIVARLVEQRI